MTAPRRSVPAPIKVVISASLLLASGGVLSLASCFGALSTINNSRGAGFWGYLLFAGLGFVALGVLLFVGIGVWAVALLVKHGVRRLRGEAG
jgi:hypothetical protein